MDAAARQHVRDRAGNRCEYCGLRREHSPLAPLQIEHIIPKKHRGSDESGSGSMPTGPTACAARTPDVSTSDGWRSTQASQPAFGSLRFKLMARPAFANLDGMVAIGGQDIEDFPDAAIAVRFAEDGHIDARDGSSYGSDASFAYDPGVWYSIVVTADVDAQTYDVEVGRCGESPEILIRGAAFRPDASVADQLTAWAV